MQSAGACGTNHKVNSRLSDTLNRIEHKALDIQSGEVASLIHKAATRHEHSQFELRSVQSRNALTTSTKFPHFMAVPSPSAAKYYDTSSAKHALDVSQ